MSKVQIYIDQDRVDLFGDEKISLTTKLNDIEKLSNVFTDFTQPFTVPATDNNNNIFNHYYDLDIDNSFNVNVRVPGYIEYNTLPFRTGNIQLESVKMVNHKPSSYKITFYGDIKQLTDLFEEDTLQQLDDHKDGTIGFYNGLSQFDYNLSIDSWTASMYDDSGVSNNGHTITPLILVADRDVNYGTVAATSSLDISSIHGPLNVLETRPAIRAIKVLEAIETKYGITFGRKFFGSANFKNLFLWLNRNEDMNFSGSDVAISSGFIGTDTGTGNFTVDSPYISVQRRTTSDILITDLWVYYLRYRYTVTPDVGFEDVLYSMSIVDEEGNVISESSTDSGTRTINKIWESGPYIGGTIQTSIEKCKLVITPLDSFDAEVDIEVDYYKYHEFCDICDPDVVFIDLSSINNSVSMGQLILISDNMVEIPVIEFIQSLMKMFKLVVRPTSTSDFDFVTINNFYKGGQTWNLTEYIDNDNIEIQRPSIYSKIDFHYEKTDNVLGKKFRETFDPFNDKIGYGDLSGTYEVDSKEKLEVDIPFENMLFERLLVVSTDATNGDRTNIIIGQSSELS